MTLCGTLHDLRKSLENSSLPISRPLVSRLWSFSARRLGPVGRALGTPRAGPCATPHTIKRAKFGDRLRCTFTGEFDEERPGAAPEAYRKIYFIEADSCTAAEAEARRRFEGDLSRPPTDDPVCELESLVEIREASQSDLSDPRRRRRLVRAARKDGASMEDIEAAQRANPHWPQ
jgi:hypothetical protein